MSKLPNLRGVSSALDKLRSAIEDDAKAFLEGVEEAHQKRGSVFLRAHEKLGEQKAALEEVDGFLEQFEAAIGDNGGPTLDGSSQPSESTEQPK